MSRAPRSRGTAPAGSHCSVPWGSPRTQPLTHQPPPDDGPNLGAIGRQQPFRHPCLAVRQTRAHRPHRELTAHTANCDRRKNQIRASHFYLMARIRRTAPRARRCGTPWPPFVASCDGKRFSGLSAAMCCVAPVRGFEGCPLLRPIRTLSDGETNRHKSSP